MSRERLIVLEGDAAADNLYDVYLICWHTQSCMDASSRLHIQFLHNYATTTVYMCDDTGILNSVWQANKNHLLAALTEQYSKHPVKFCRSKKSGNYLRVFF